MERLTIEVPTSRQRTTTQTRRVVTRPQQGVSEDRAGLLSARERPLQLVVNRPVLGNSDFDVLKKAKEGVWYRRLVDEEGVSLIRVKNDDVILNGNRQKTNENQRTNEDLTLKDKERSEGNWYRRVDDGYGGVRLVRVRNDDIIIKSLKTFKTQTTTRTRKLEAA